MPRLKTHKGTAKRFKITGSGKVRHHRVGRRHLMASKTARRGRALRRPDMLAKVDVEKIRLLLPYGN